MIETNLKGNTPDIAEENVQKLKQIFPDVFTEDKVDFEKLQQVLGDYVEDSNECYNFTWNGKGRALRLSQTPSLGTLRPCKEESKDWDTTQNLYIEGDNLEVLKLLQKSYYGKVKMIYIDPPYNTGNDFIYKDNFTMSKEDYDEEQGIYDEDENRLFQNNESNGRFHSDWCSMIYSRLMLARNLLTDDGLIFISIDDNELDNLIKVTNEIFGEKNYINVISLFTKVSAGASGGGEDRRLKKNMEYILMYAKNSDALTALPSIYKETELMDYIQQMKSSGKSFKYTNVLYSYGDIEEYKTIKDGSGQDIIIKKVNSYDIKTVKQISKLESITEEEVYEKYFSSIMTTTNAQTSIRDRVWEATDNENNLYIATYVPNSGKNKGVATNLFFTGKQKVLMIWLKDTAEKINGKIYKKEKIGTFWDGFSWINVTKEGDVKFENGKKPIALIQQLAKLVYKNEDIIVLDFFSGSATTAHAVMQLNAEDGGNRKFIMVQIPEETDEKSEAYKAGYKNICEIGKERIRRAGEKIKEENKDKEKIANLDIGFKVLKLDASNIRKWQPDYDNLEQSILEYVDNYVEGRTELDVVYEIMLKYGLDLTYPVDEFTVAQKKVYSIGFGMLMICLDNEITTEVAKGILEKVKELAPESTRVIFKDDGFKNGFKTDRNKVIQKDNHIFN